MATRVFELARQLDVRSKDVLEKCRAEGIELKNHMAALSAGLEETIRDWFSEEAPEAKHTAVETTDHVDLEKAREEAKKERRRRGKKEAEVEAPAEPEAETPPSSEEAPVEAEETPEPPQPEQIEQPVIEAETEMPAEVAPVEAELPAEAEVEEVQPEQPAVEVEASVVQEEVAEQPPAPAEVAEEEPAQKKKTKKAKKEKKPQKEKKAVDKKGAPAGITPAGPQLVPAPAKLKGPRVVRVERPDYAPRPTPRQQGSGGQRPPHRRGGAGAPPMIPPVGAGTRGPGRAGTAGSAGPGRGGPGADKKTRRSPRRKNVSGRNSQKAGEKLREWRNQDLVERAARISGAASAIRRRRPMVKRGGAMVSSGAKKGKVEIQEPITIKSLSAETGIKSGEIIKKLMAMGTLATINQVIDVELAESVMVDFDVELVVARAKTAEDRLQEKLEAREKGEMVSRAPVVTFLGHVDHGKTSLLDYIRSAKVAGGEAGGITQAIGSYRHDFEDQHVVFLDTPGHEAFTAMRARGANMTDVVVLVCAADDGVMPQTIEAISHAKAAGVPIVVALNKIDVPNANPMRALTQLAEHGLQSREWGGDTEVVQTSAINGEGMDHLVELLSLESEMLELKAEVDAPASGYVVEAQMDPGKGVLATILNINGTLKIGDVVVAGKGYGRVRQIYSDKGKVIKKAGPAMPVMITGLDEVPEAGDKFYVVDDVDEARAVAVELRQENRSKQLAAQAGAPRSLEEMLGQIEAGKVHELPIILKADVQGSIEALTGSLSKINTDEVKLNILHTGVGGVSSGDVTLAEASNAIIIGFNVVADAQARRLAEQKNVDIRVYRVIYDIIEDMRRALEEGLAPELKEEQLGRAEIRQTFKISRLGTIAGCYVTEGIIQRNANLRIIRNSVVIEDSRKLDSLKRHKDDVREVKAGLECGLKVDGYDDIKEGDILEFYKEVEVARSL